MGDVHERLRALYEKQKPVSKCCECYMAVICPFAKEKGVTGCLGGYGIDESSNKQPVDLKEE